MNTLEPMTQAPQAKKANRWEMTGVAALVVVFALWAGNWALEGLIHSRKTQIVPDLKGRSIASALDQLSNVNLSLRKTSVEFNSSVPIASILRQDPPPGTVVREGKTIRVVVSQGGQTVQAPTLVGLPQRNAELLLRQNQLSLGEVTESYSLKSPKGEVLSQTPAGETSVERDALVNLVVSGGTPPAGVVLMPDFQRRTIDEVNSWAASVNLHVTVRLDASSLFASGTVLMQNPVPDAVLAADAPISVTVSGRKSAVQTVAQTFRYELAQGGSDSQVRIVVVDKYGERELFNGLRKPGSKIEVPVQSLDGARVKIYLNGILVEERDL